MDLRSLVNYYQEKDKVGEEKKAQEQSYPQLQQQQQYYQQYYAYYGYGQQPQPSSTDKKRKAEDAGDAEVQEANDEVKKSKVDDKKGKKKAEEEDEEEEEESSDEDDSSSEEEGEGDGEGKKLKKKKRREGEAKEYSEFHGDTMYDYQGRTYISPPSNLRAAPHECFMPKKMLHQWRLGAGKKNKSKRKKAKDLRRKKMRMQQQQKGNKLGNFSVETVISKPQNQDPTNGVNAIRLFPKYGHLVISANLDGTVKLFDLYNDKRCLRTFYGHTKGVRDIQFNHDGSQFLSTSFDRTIKLWDTETGACIQRFSNRKLAYCVKFPPHARDQNQFIAGCSDNRVHQWDIRTGSTVQEYNYHLGPVNALEFIDEGRRFISSSDDKSLRVWEWGIPVEIKEIREPYLHSMPVMAPHPTDPWIITQSMDNQILVVSTKDKFRMNKKKRFLGHLVAGYACQLGFSPDGHYVISGDGTGNLWIWDWKTHRILKKLECHEKVLIGCEWHPVEPSRVVTCSWDGTIKLWD
ncbi:EH-binding protein, putative [Acanthamoeba castellanii str. Neff]|uniref:Pre-mRNA-processing factor 17 n=1 Tax=Acanthamoeba castellanii (strain ATCC 30010 / Neff) TaxID=1257118 RepID=L8GMD9_ACACF|nr:EH-binding protein, putative [Acanthamoeba castellanii str. Neff]ELR13923.1 EH-binding protein, putative [Acanthamoeba castellanii str. Neff]